MKKYSYLLVLLLLILSGCGSNPIKSANEGDKINVSEPTIQRSVTGVFEPVKDDKNSTTINFTNGWKQEILDEKMVIIAEVGNLKTDPMQGIVVVQNQKMVTGEILSEKKFLTPSKHGSIKIAQTNNFNFTIEAADKTSFLFNVYNGFTNNPK